MLKLELSQSEIEAISQNAIQTKSQIGEEDMESFKIFTTYHATRMLDLLSRLCDMCVEVETLEATTPSKATTFLVRHLRERLEREILEIMTSQNCVCGETFLSTKSHIRDAYMRGAKVYGFLASKGGRDETLEAEVIATTVMSRLPNALLYKITPKKELDCEATKRGAESIRNLMTVVQNFSESVDMYDITIAYARKDGSDSLDDDKIADAMIAVKEALETCGVVAILRESKIAPTSKTTEIEPYGGEE